MRGESRHLDIGRSNMADALKQNRAAWLAVGALLGLAAGIFLPHSPAHAVATDRIGDFAIATGPLDD
jgi:hypothetical protein